MSTTARQAASAAGTEVETIKRIITHPGIFHADDVFAVATLRIAGVTAPVFRRLPTEDELNDPTVIILDIGGRFEPSRRNFDHHQKGGAGKRLEAEIPYASFGLVWNYSNLLKQEGSVHDRVDKQLVAAVDLTDCMGANVYSGKPVFTVSHAVSGFNPNAGASPAERDAAFFAAVDWAIPVIKNAIREAEVFVAARTAVMSAPTFENGRVLCLPKFVPWGEHVFSRPDAENLLYVIFPSERGGWCIQQVPVEPNSNQGRKPLPEAWAGLRGQDLLAVVNPALPESSRLQDGPAVFCHAGRFIGGAQTEADVRALAALAVRA